MPLVAPLTIKRTEMMVILEQAIDALTSLREAFIKDIEVVAAKISDGQGKLPDEKIEKLKEENFRSHMATAAFAKQLRDMKTCLDRMSASNRENVIVQAWLLSILIDRIYIEHDHDENVDWLGIEV